MCLAAWALHAHPRWRFVLASNRDEFFDRPAEPLHWWTPPGAAEPLLGGRDASAGGTWLGISRAGRLALVTNVREPGAFDPMLGPAASRGALVPAGLAHGPGDEAWLRAEMARPRNGWNLLLADLPRGEARWASNRAAHPQTVAPGAAGLSNAQLDTPWPKLRRLREQVSQQVAAAAAAPADALIERLLADLRDEADAPEAELPHTGVPWPREQALGRVFIRIPADGASAEAPALYGTRCSTVVLAEATPAGLRLHVHERRFDAGGYAAGDTRQAWSWVG